MKILKTLKNILVSVNKKTEDIKKHKAQELEQIERSYEISWWNNKDSHYTKWDPLNIFIFWFIWAFVVYLCYVIFQSLYLVYLIMSAYIISIAVEVLIEFFQRKMPRWLAILISYVLICAILVSGFILIVPFVLNQSVEVIKLLIDKVHAFQIVLQTKWIDQIINEFWFLPWYAKKLLISSLNNAEAQATLQSTLQQNVSQIIAFGSSYVKNVWWIVVTVVTSLFSVIYNIVLVLMLSIFFSMEKDGVINFIASVSGRKHLVSIKLKKLYKKLWFWLKWQLLLWFFIGIATWILLTSLSLFGIHLPNIATLAMIAWLTEFIPYIWPSLWAIPALLVAVSSYWFTWFVAVLLVYMILQWAENNVLVPLVMNQALWVSPLVIFVAMLIWASVLWFIGILLAVPIAVIVTLIFEDMVKDN